MPKARLPIYHGPDYIAAQEPLEYEQVQACIEEMTPEGQAGIEALRDWLIRSIPNMGKQGALVLIGELLRKGLIGPGPVDADWLLRVRRSRW